MLNKTLANFFKPRNPASSVRVNELVFFLVTNLEHEVLQSGRHAQTADMYVGSTIGELGCWVDPAVTRMVQTGVEHSRIPEAAAYLGAGQNELLSSRFPLMPHTLS